MATNGTTRRIAELRLPTGTGADGNPAYIVVGYHLETDWGKDKPKSYDVEFVTANLQPCLYQQVAKAAEGRVTVVCKKADFSKRYKVDVKVQPPSAPGEDAEGNDPDCGRD